MHFAQPGSIRPACCSCCLRTQPWILRQAGPESPRPLLRPSEQQVNLGEDAVHRMDVRIRRRIRWCEHFRGAAMAVQVPRNYPASGSALTEPVWTLKAPSIYVGHSRMRQITEPTQNRHISRRPRPPSQLPSWPPSTHFVRGGLPPSLLLPPSILVIRLGQSQRALQCHRPYPSKECPLHGGRDSWLCRSLGACGTSPCAAAPALHS